MYSVHNHIFLVFNIRSVMMLICCWLHGDKSGTFSSCYDVGFVVACGLFWLVSISTILVSWMASFMFLKCLP